MFHISCSIITMKVLRVVLILCYAFLLNTAECSERNRRTTHSKCYTYVGCITIDSTLPLPQEPNEINSTTMVFHRPNTGAPTATISAQRFPSEIAQFAAHVDSRKPTKVIVHGYLHSSKTPWVPKMKDELLKKGDFNVLVVDWSYGNGPDYDQAASNTYMVGTELAYLINHLHQHYSLNTSDVHIIGHSLGAQVAGHAGHRIDKVGRITGLDPAEPHFTFPDPNTRLDSTDGEFVDIIHTDGAAFSGYAGYGLMTALGHVDFYVNGGEQQRGCQEPSLSSINAILHGGLQSVFDFPKFKCGKWDGLAFHKTRFNQAAGSVFYNTTYDIFNSPLLCNHMRAVDYFIESINSPCIFYGYRCASSSDFDSGKCLQCPKDNCPAMGYGIDPAAPYGSYYLSTSDTSPFCGNQYYVEIHMAFVMNQTVGELFVNLIGTNISSEEIKYSRSMETYTQKTIHGHIITSRTVVTNITGIQVKFVKGHTAGVDNSIHVQSVVVEKLSPNRSKVICGHNVEIANHNKVTFICNPST